MRTAILNGHGPRAGEQRCRSGDGWRSRSRAARCVRGRRPWGWYAHAHKDVAFVFERPLVRLRLGLKADAYVFADAPDGDFDHALDPQAAAGAPMMAYAGTEPLGAAFQPPAAVPWRLECRHDASTERPRQATCPRQEGGSAPAPRCRRWLGRGRRDGELAPPVRTSRLARRRPDCSRPVGNVHLARTAGTDLRRLTCGDVLRQQTALSRAPWRRRQGSTSVPRGEPTPRRP